MEDPAINHNVNQYLRVEGVVRASHPDLAAFGDEIVKRLDTRFTQITGSIIEKLSKIHVEATSASNKRLDKLEKASGAVQDFEVKLDTFHKKIKESVTIDLGLSCVHSSIDKAQKDLSQKLDRLERKIDHMQTESENRLRAQIDETKAEVTALKGQMDKGMGDVQTRQNDLFDRLDELDNNMRNVTDDCMAGLASIGGGLSNLGEKLEEHIEQVRGDITTSKNELSNQLNVAQGGIENVCEDVRTSRNELRDQLNQTQADIETRLDDRLDQMHQEATSMAIDIRDAEDRLGQRLDTIDSNVLDFRDHFQNQHTEARESLEALGNQIIGNIDQLRAITSATSTRTEQLVQAVGALPNQFQDKLNQVNAGIDTTRSHLSDKLGSVSTDMASRFDNKFNQTWQNLKALQGELIQKVHQEVTTAQNHVVDTLNEAHVNNIHRLRLEMRAGHFNNAARLANKSASCCNELIAQFRGIDNRRIPGFPPSITVFQLLGDDINGILEKLGLSTGGTLCKRKQRLKIYLGLRRS